MGTRCLALALAAALGFGVAAPGAGGKAKADAERIARLVEQLGSPRYADRQKAGKALAAIGVPALDALRKAVDSTDRETARRARDLVARIEKRAEAEAILAPTRVRLACKDLPVTDAVARLAKLSRYNLQVEPNSREKLSERTVTLDTGNTTFWEALDQLCDKARIHETEIGPFPGGQAWPAQPGGAVPIQRFRIAPAPAGAVPAAPAAPARPNQARRLPVRPVNAGVALAALAQVQPAALPAVQPAANWGRRGIGPEPVAIVLADGKPEKVPTCYRGAFRIRLRTNPADADPRGQVLPAVDGKLVRPAAPAVLAVRLEVTAEPRLFSWFLTDHVKLEKAADDQDQALTLALQTAIDEPVFVRRNLRFRGGGAVILADDGLPAVTDGRSVVLRIKPGERPARALKALRGTLTARVTTPPEPLITVDHILKAAGKTVKGARGGSLQVVHAEKRESGDYEVRCVLERPDNSAEVGGAWRLRGFVGGAMRVRRVRLLGGRARFFSPNGGLSLQDAKGNALTPAGYTASMNNGSAVELTLLFRADEGQGEPARLVYTGQRDVTLDVPFTFRDVKLR